MKKLILTLAAFSALTFTGVAQDNHKAPANADQAALMTPEQKAENDTKKATDKLGLTADQQAKFKVYALDRARSNKGLREKAKAATSKEEKQKYRAEAKANNDKFFANVSTILNAEQQAKWAEHKKKMDERQANQQD